MWGMDKLPYRKRVEMLVMYREPLRPPRTARRAGLRKPDGLRSA